MPPRPTDAHAVHAQLRLAVYHVARTSYRRLHAEIEHPHWAISHVADGEVRLVNGAGAWRVPGGSVMIHPPGRAYAEYAERPGTHEWMIFEARIPPEQDLLQFHPLPAVVRLRASHEFSATFARLLAAWRRPPADPARDLYVYACAAGLLAQLIGEWRAAGAVPRDGVSGPAQSRFTGLIHYMSAHLHGRVTRAQLAREAHLQPNYLDRVFRSAYGLAPMRMLRRLRMQRARHLLENTGETVETIAADCGFGDASRFTRAFRAEFGEPPGRYRQGVKSARTRYDPP